MNIEIKDLPMSDKLEKKINMVCRFAGVKPNIIKGEVRNIKGTNIAFVKPHILSVNDKNYLLFDESDDIFVNGFKSSIKFKDLKVHIRTK